MAPQEKSTLECDPAIEWGIQENVFHQGGSTLLSAEGIWRWANLSDQPDLPGNPFKKRAIKLAEVRTYLTACAENRVTGRGDYEHPRPE